jgi:multicomponent Na+:H+ antiporter subunit B
MNPALRRLLLVPALAVMLGGLVWGLTGLPDFGHYLGPYGDIINHSAVPDRHATNAVGATVFDYRAIDTLGEEFILFCALMGVVLLLRGHREEEAPEADRVQSDALRVFGLLLLGPALVIAAWLAAFGYVTPGGGFQGGVVFAGAVLLLYLASGYRPFAKASKEDVMDVAEGVGAGGYVVIGLVAVVSGLPFLHNLLGSGTKGGLAGAGSIPFLNWASAIEVAAANILLFGEFLAVYIVPLVRREQGR